MTTALDFAQALLGDCVDVVKMDPGVSDVHSLGESNRAGTPPLRRRRRRLVGVSKDSSTGRKILAGTGVVATGIGGALGVRELADSAEKLGHPELMHAVRGAGAVVPKRVMSVVRNPKVKIGAVGGMLAGDAIATGEQVHAIRSRERRRRAVGKAAPLGDMVEGILHNSRTLSALHTGEEIPGKHRATAGYQGKRRAEKPPKLVGTDAAIARGTAVRSDVGRMASTTSGKVAIGAGGLMALSGHRRRTSAPPDPYGIYKRDDLEITGTISKLDDDKRLAFGWANVSKVNGVPVVDRQDDYCSIEDIEEAAYAYVENSRVGGIMHRRAVGKLDGEDRPLHVSNLVESMVFDDAKCEALGLANDFPRGWWVGFRVHDDTVWNLAKRGELTGFSVHGKGIRRSCDYDELMSS